MNRIVPVVPCALLLAVVAGCARTARKPREVEALVTRIEQQEAQKAASIP